MSKIDVFNEIVGNMVEGTMFHNQMVQYFSYLGLSGFAELQKIRFEHENAEMCDFEQYCVEVYGELISSKTVNARDYFPSELKENSRELSEINDAGRYVRFGIETWRDWERSSKELYGKTYFELSDLRDCGASERVSEIVRETEMEMRFAYNLMCKLRNCDYDMGAICVMDCDIVKEYKRFMKKEV